MNTFLSYKASVQSDNQTLLDRKFPAETFYLFTMYNKTLNKPNFMNNLNNSIYNLNAAAESAKADIGVDQELVEDNFSVVTYDPAKEEYYMITYF